MNDNGEVRIEIVLGVLRAHKCGVDLGGDTISVSCPEGLVFHVFTHAPVLRRNLVIRLARKFNIPSDHFYHPLRAPDFTPEDIQ